MGRCPENLSRYYAHGVKANSLIENVVEKGPVGFIAVEDIAQTAFKGITDVESLPNREPILIGPELVSYQEVSFVSPLTTGFARWLTDATRRSQLF